MSRESLPGPQRSKSRRKGSGAAIPALSGIEDTSSPVLLLSHLPCRCEAPAHFPVSQAKYPIEPHGTRSWNLIPACQYFIRYCLAFFISAFPQLSLKSRSPKPRADLVRHLVAHQLDMSRDGTRLPPSGPLCNVCSGFHLKKDDSQGIFSNDGSQR